ncbi:patatin-like phospholipase family protein [Desulfoplanes sp.]
MHFYRHISMDELHSAKVGIALGSGAARGISHIGMLQALEELGITPFCMAGTSVGAIMGSMYTAGRFKAYTARLRQWTRKDTLNILDLVLPKSGLIEGNKFIEFHRQYLNMPRFEDCDIPMAMVMTDARTGDQVVAQTGDICKALRGTISVPGFITPAQDNGRILLDGALVNPLPIDICRAMGADLVIGVDVNSKFIKSKIQGKIPGANRSKPLPSFLSQQNFITSWVERLEGHDLFPSQFFNKLIQRKNDNGSQDISLFEILSNTIDIMENALKETRLAKDPPDILLKPDTRQISFLDIHLANEAIAAGEKSVREMMDGIKKTDR